MSSRAKKVVDIYKEKQKGEGIKEAFKAGDRVKVNLSKIDKTIPAYFKLVKKIIKDGGGDVEILTIKGPDAEVAASRMSGLILGAVRVPLIALKK